METIPGLLSGADISAKYLEAVTLSTGDFQVNAITANTDCPIGILHNKPDAASQGATVIGPGNVCKARYGGTVTIGQRLSVDTDGELVAVTEGSDTTRYIIAIALEAGVNQGVYQVLVVTPHRAS